MPGLSFWNASPNMPMTFSIEVEPSVATFPPAAGLLPLDPPPHPVKAAMDKRAIKTVASNFFNMIQFPFKNNLGLVDCLYLYGILSV